MEEQKTKQLHYADSHTHQATPTESKGQFEWSFSLPELPCGQEVVVRIHSTWGDRHYVGLTGIEIFTSEGLLAPVKKVRDFVFLSNYIACLSFNKTYVALSKATPQKGHCLNLDGATAGQSASVFKLASEYW